MRCAPWAAQASLHFDDEPDQRVDAGVRPMTSCEVGICGSCATHVLEREPIHGDNCLREAAI